MHDYNKAVVKSDGWCDAEVTDSSTLCETVGIIKEKCYYELRTMGDSHGSGKNDGAQDGKGVEGDSSGMLEQVEATSMIHLQRW